MIDATHDPALRSWVDSANDPASDFPPQNLPFGVFRREAGDARVGVAIGDVILDVAAAHSHGLLDDAAAACAGGSLNALMAGGAAVWDALRQQLSDLLRAHSERGREAASRAAELLVPQRAATMLLPAAIGDYTDFYASIVHATNVGSMFRPDNPLLPNYKWVPIGYHGRASSIVVSGTPIRRPLGQGAPEQTGAAPVFGPSRRLDYEVELGLYVGPGNSLGSPIPIARAGEHLFGVSLLNDWSARDIQAWEYQPLGPFLGKNFATTVAPWIVTRAALAPFRTALAARADGDPAPLPYLEDAHDRAHGALDIVLEAELQSRAMRQRGLPPVRLSRASAAGLYWSPAQLIAHHASNGCNLQPGDLLGSGTVSGSERAERGCLLELTWRGSEPLTLPSGETRRFLEDGDVLTLRGYCERDGFRRIGFGSCSGQVLPAPA